MVEIDRRRGGSIPGLPPSARGSRAGRAPSGRDRAPAGDPADSPDPQVVGSTGPSPDARRGRFVPPPLDPESQASDACRLLLAALGESASDHAGEIFSGGDGEALHDLRVSLRRARCLLGPLRGVFSPAEVERLRGGLRWLGELTGPARDLDVLLERLRARRRDFPDQDREAIDSLAAWLSRDREPLRRALCKGLASARRARLMEAWRRIAARRVAGSAAVPRPAGSQRSRSDGPAGERPIDAVAAEAIARAWRRLLRRGEAIDETSPPASFHRLRIDGKKVRYLLELFRSTYRGVDLDPVIDRLKALQDCLGDLNDVQVQEDALRAIARRMAAEGRAAPDVLLVIGRLIERSGATARAGRRRFPDRFAALRTRENRRVIGSLAP